MDFETIMQKIAMDDGTTPEKVREGMEAAIQAAKDNPNFRQLFGGRVPSIEEFVLTTARLVNRNRQPQ